MSYFKTMPNLVSDMLSSLLKDDDYDVAKISFNWSKIIDSRYSSFTKPVKISLDFKTRKKTLFVSVSNNSFGTELHYMKKGIIDKVNSFCGAGTVEDIRVVLKPCPKKH